MKLQREDSQTDVKNVVEDVSKALDNKKHQVEQAVSDAALEAFKRFDQFRSKVAEEQKVVEDVTKNAKAAFARFDAFLKAGSGSEDSKKEGE